MQIKKENQWKIDRAFKVSKENENRLKSFLSSIRLVKSGEKTEDQAIDDMRQLGVLANCDSDNARGKAGYEQSTATLFRSFGFIAKNAYETTEVSDLYLDGDISFESLITLQLLKKEFIYNKDETGEVLHPLEITLKVLLSIIEKNPQEAWIDSYDYFYYLCEVKKASEIDKCADEIIESHKSSIRDNRYIINDFDMWSGVFLSTGLFTASEQTPVDSRTTRYSLNTSELDFIKWLIKQELPVLRTYKRYRNDNEQRRFGMIDTSIISQIPQIKIDTTKEYEVKGILAEKELLELYLFDGKSYRDIEKIVFGEEVDAKGNMASAVLSSYGIVNSEVKGIFMPFKNRKDLVRVSMKNIMNSRLYKVLFEEMITDENLDDEMKQENQFLSPILGRSEGGYNKIYYGIPGCGKSYKVKHEVLKDVADDNIFYTTFYLDYTNSDFVGQLVPKTDEQKNVTYEPNFGPFSKALKRACETTDMVYLVIEEINRGNAAAIFGDLFQLLDRMDEAKVLEKNDGSVVGDSEYPITNNFIEDYLHFEPGKVIIPSNLSIIATMNTSDQNVFPLDTAFKRRWDRESVVTDWSKVKMRDKCIPFTDFTWEHFVEEVNGRMTSDEANGTISPDKKIGPYFISESVLVEKEKRHENSKENKERMRMFANNVVDYLYNDVTKFDHEIMFREKNNYDNVYSALIEISRNPDPNDGPQRFIEIFAGKIISDIKSSAEGATKDNGENNNT